MFGHSVMSDSLRPRGLPHSRLPCSSLSPGVCSNSCPLSWWYHPTISSSVIPFSSCPQSFLVSGSFQMSQSFPSGGQSIGDSILQYFPKYWSFRKPVTENICKLVQEEPHMPSHSMYVQHTCTTYILPHTSPPPSFRTMSYNIIEGDHWGSPYLLGIPCCAPASRTSFKHLGLFWFTFISVEKSVSSYIGSLHWHILCPLPGISPICTFSWRLLLSLQASAQELLEGEDEAFLIF